MTIQDIADELNMCARNQCGKCKFAMVFDCETQLIKYLANICEHIVLDEGDDGK